MLQGSRDNMSIVIIAFEGAPKVSEEAQKKEALLDARLEAKVKGDVLIMIYRSQLLILAQYFAQQLKRRKVIGCSPQTLNRLKF